MEVELAPIWAEIWAMVEDRCRPITNADLADLPIRLKKIKAHTKLEDLAKNGENQIKSGRVWGGVAPQQEQEQPKTCPK